MYPVLAGVSFWMVYENESASVAQKLPCDIIVL